MKSRFRMRWLIVMAIATFSLICLYAVHLDGRWPPLSPSGVGKAPQANPESVLRSPTPPEIQPRSRVDSQRLFDHVQALAFVRHTPAERQRAQDYIVKELNSLGWSTTQQNFANGSNLMARCPQPDPEAERILVAAHYDSVAGSPGADDNASAVATVLELARLFSDGCTQPVSGDRSPQRNLELVLFDAEEAGALGSYAYADQPANLTHLAAVIVVEMVGYACHTPGCQQRPQGLAIDPPTELGDFLTVVGDAEHQPLLQVFEQIQQPDLPPLLTLSVPFKGVLTPDLLRSDHAPFWFQGIGAVMVTDTANFRNPHYHQPSDRPETLDRDFLQGAAQAIANATAQLLNSQTRLVTERSP